MVSKITGLVIGLTLSLTANAALITSDENVGTPLVTGSTEDFHAIIGANTTFAHAVHFTTDSNASQASSAVIGLELADISGFTGPFTVSLYQDNYVAGENTNDSVLVASVVGTNLNNVALQTNTQYSFVIEGQTSANTPNNLITGSVGVTPVPIPASAWLFGSALLGFNIIRKRR